MTQAADQGHQGAEHWLQSQPSNTDALLLDTDEEEESNPEDDC
jgi:hypothetical protein